MKGEGMMGDMILRHWSVDPLGDLRNTPPSNRRVHKPEGLWLSDESDFGWRQWCIDEQWGVSALKHWTDFRVDRSRVLWLSEAAQIERLALKYTSRDRAYRFRDEPDVDWVAIGRDYAGIVITPYQWDVRLDVRWYYGWDVASGCFWDVSCLERVAEGVGDPVPEPAE